VVSAPDAADLDGLERDADDRLYAAERAGATAPSPVPEYAGGMPADARG
jgi:hypothetical protein